MDVQIVAAIVGTGLTVGGAVAVSGRWVVGAVIREDTQNLRDAMLALTKTAETLTGELKAAKELQAKGTDELHNAIKAVRDVLANHQERIAVLESKTSSPSRRPAIRGK